MSHEHELPSHEALGRHDTVAPAESPAFKAVLAVAAQSGVDQDALTRLFWLMNAHPRLLGHQRCLQNLASLLSTPEFLDGVHGWADAWTADIPAWAHAARWASGLSHTDRPALDAFVRAPRDHRHHVMMRHGINRHPCAGALWIRHHSDPEESLPTASLAAPGRMFRLLEWHLFCSQVEARGRRSTLEQYLKYDLPAEWPAWPRPAAAVGLAVRQLSYRESDTLLKELPYQPRLDEFADALVKQKEQLLVEFEDAAMQQRIVALISYFQDVKSVLDGQPTKPKREGGSGRGGGRQGVPGFVHFTTSPGVFFEPPEPASGDEDVPCRNATRVHILNDELTPQTITDLEVQGIAPAEDLRPIMDLFPIEERPGGIHSLWTMRQATEAAAHKNYWDKSQLTPLEVAALLDAINLNEPDRSTPFDKGLDEAARLTLSCMLVFGCGFEDARTIRTLSSTELSARAVTGDSLATRFVLVDEETGLCTGFAVPAIGPRYTSRLPDCFFQNANAAQPFITLPDLTGLGLALLQHQRRTNNPSEGPVFCESPAELEGEVERLLASTNRGLDAVTRPRLTTTKVSRKLPSMLSRAGVDEVGVAILCGDRRYEGQARLHYTQHQSDDLAKAYTKAIRRLFAEAGHPIAPSGLPVPPSAGVVVGARLIVTTANLRAFIGGLRTELAEAPSLTRSARHRYHQAFMLYALVMQGLLMSVRPSNQPERLLADLLAHGRLLDREDFVAALVEKDDQYESRARAVAVPNRLRRQFGHLIDHAEATWRWRPVDLAIPSTTLAQSLFLDWADDQAKPHAHVVDVQWLTRQLAQFGLPAPANFTRAYVRTWLIRDGCAEQVVDAFLGHAAVGQSPLAMHGTFDFAHHLVEIGARLERMADELGLEPVRSRLADPEASPSVAPPLGA